MSELDVRLTVVEVCQCEHLTYEAVVEIVETGIIHPMGDEPRNWEFDTQMMGVLRKAHRLQRDLEMDWNSVALALRLLHDLEIARAENARLRQLLGH
ncbi:MAG: chaperone modulatory protein CbpM [Halioglobus sp.]|nr:chaperone modulatory protein CbpM [Halioglobus sp.]